METISLVGISTIQMFFNNVECNALAIQITDKDGITRDASVICDNVGKHVILIDSQAHLLFSFSDAFDVRNFKIGDTYDVDVHRYNII